MCVLHGLTNSHHAPGCTDRHKIGRAPSNLDPPIAKEILLLKSLLATRETLEENTTSGATIITRQDYPALVELNIAGRSDLEIADRLDTSVRQVRSHVSQAMALYRSGDLLIDSGNAVSEARSKGAETALEAVDRLNGMSEQTSATLSVSV